MKTLIIVVGAILGLLGLSFLVKKHQEKQKKEAEETISGFFENMKGMAQQLFTPQTAARTPDEGSIPCQVIKREEPEPQIKQPFYRQAET